MSQRATSKPYGLRRERLGAAEPGIVGHARRRGKLGRAVRPEHQHSDSEGIAPPNGVQGDDSRSVQDHEAAKTMGSSVVAAGAPVRADTVVDFEGAALDNNPHAEAVNDADTSRVGSVVGLGERRRGVGDVLGCEDERRLRGGGAGRLG